MILEQPCPDCPPPPQEGMIHCCPVWGMGSPDRASDCCATCGCRRVLLTDDGRAVLDLVRRHLETEGHAIGSWVRGKLVPRRG